jgi:hypothetical protein
MYKKILKIGWALLWLGNGANFQLGAIDWPTQTGELVRDFGSNDGGTASVGETFVGTGPVHAAGGGELVFKQDSSTLANRLPSPLGAWVAVDQGDGIVGIYGRMENPRDFQTPIQMEKGTILGTMGKTGWTGATGFYFSLYDRGERQWINPALVLTPNPNERPPMVRGLYLVTPEGTKINAAQTKQIRQGAYRLLVDFGESRGAAKTYALIPLRTQWYINGVAQGLLLLETLETKNGQRMVTENKKKAVDQVYQDDQTIDMGTGLFNRGKATLEISIRDKAGNERNITYQLTVE